MNIDRLELSPRRKRQATLLSHFASLDYLKGLLFRVENLILYAERACQWQHASGPTSDERAVGRKTIRQIVESRYGAKYRELTSIAGLVDFVSARLSKRRLMKQMDFYSLGVVMKVEFGYHTDKEDTYRLRDAQARMLHPQAFDSDAKISSYACRTGLGNDIGSSLDKGEDPGYGLSLAQVLADSADVVVHAFPRRSLYDGTFGTADERRIGEQTSLKKKRYMEELRRYRIGLAEYERRAGSSARGSSGNSGEPPPQPPAKPYSQEEELLAQHVESRDSYTKTDGIGLPLDALGAVHSVRSGMTPSGLPMGLMKFTPRRWKMK